MDSPSSTKITELLRAWSSGDQQALDELYPLIHTELRRRADRVLRQLYRGQTLQPTALIDEVFLKMLGQERAQWHNRVQFFAVVADLMYRIVIDYLRKNYAAKRGAGARKLTLDEVCEVSKERAPELLALDDALQSFAKVDPEKCRLVKLRFFVGLSVEETAEVLGVSPATVVRQWRSARSWLYRELSKEAKSDADHTEPRTLATD